MIDADQPLCQGAPGAPPPRGNGSCCAKAEGAPEPGYTMPGFLCGRATCGPLYPGHPKASRRTSTTRSCWAALI